MNHQLDDQLDFERMIDGELSFAEQRALLARLDGIPDGWRRLALGLLEEQAFRREFQHAHAEEATPPVVPVVVAPPLRSTRRLHWLATVAACLLCLWGGALWSQRQGQAELQVWKASVDAGAELRLTAAEAWDAQQIVTNTLAEVLAEVFPSPGSVTVAETDESSPVMQQTMKVSFGDWPASVIMPVIEATDDVATGLLEQSAVSDELRREWEAAGYQIRENRKLVSIPLEDGREGVAPISEIEMEYVGPGEDEI